MQLGQKRDKGFMERLELLSSLAKSIHPFSILTHTLCFKTFVSVHTTIWTDSITCHSPWTLAGEAVLVGKVVNTESLLMTRVGHAFINMDTTDAFAWGCRIG